MHVELTSLSLSPQEAFILTRIDGFTSLHDLANMLAVDHQEMEATITSFVEKGLIHFDDDSVPITKHTPENLPKAKEQNLDLSKEEQEFLMKMYACVEHGTHYDILDVDYDIEPAQLKRIYFGLSKKYHPDAYFGKNIGSFKEKLDVIFGAIKKAYEVLSDTKLRQAYDKKHKISKKNVPEAAPIATKKIASTKVDKELKQDELEKHRQEILEQRKKRMNPFTGNIQKAENYFREGLEDLRSGKLNAATLKIQMATQYDPTNESYRDVANELTERAVMEKVRKILDDAEVAVEHHNYELAAECYLEAFAASPRSSRYVYQAALLYGRLTRTDKAQQYIEMAIELSPMNPLYHIAAAEISLQQKNKKKAVQYLEKATQLAPKDTYALQLLEKMKE